MKSPKKKAAAVLAGILLVVLVLPYTVNVDSLRPRLEAALQSQLGREVHIGYLELSFLSGGAKAGDLSIADDPAFGRRPFVHAKSLKVGISFLSLIFSHTWRITSLTIDQPELVLAKSSSGKWNFSDIGSHTASTADPFRDFDPSDADMESAPRTSFSLDRLKVTNATLTMPTAPGSVDAYTLKNIDIDIDFRNASLDGSMSFIVSTHSDAGKIELRGQAGPINMENPEQTPFHATIRGARADLAQIARLSSSAGLSGILGLDATVTSDSQSLHSEGTARAVNLRLSGSGAGSHQPVSMQYVTDYSFARHSGSLSSCEISVRKSTSHLGGTYQVRGSNLIAHLRLTGSQLPLDDVEGVLPALGIHLPGGSKLNGGSVSANIVLDGPFDRLITTGTAQVANAHLSGFDLGSKLSRIPGLSGIATGSDIGIVALSSGFRIAPQGTHISNFNSQISGVGSLTGDGDIDAGDELNFKMAAHLPKGGILRTGLDYIGLKKVPDDIPFQVVGTTSVPMFLPDSSELAKIGAKAVGKEAARQGAQKFLSQSPAGKSTPPSMANAFVPTMKSEHTTPEASPSASASANKRPNLVRRIFGWHHDKKQNEPTELAKK
jgi:AsmA protein